MLALASSLCYSSSEEEPSGDGLSTGSEYLEANKSKSIFAQKRQEPVDRPIDL
jgi:hypothetical protein